MTVITTLFTNSCTVHACDSLLTQRKSDGSFEAIEFRKTKIIKVEQYRGAMSYFGFAQYGSFNLFDWLTSQLPNTQSKTPEEYAEFICEELTSKFQQLRILTNNSCGLGIHFSCYEYIDGEYFPEMFFITNFHPSISGAVNPAGFQYSRDTYKTVESARQQTNVLSDPTHREKQYRIIVKQYVNQVGLIWFNNGDPTLFLPAANAIFNAFMVLKNRGYLVNPFDRKECRDLARRPVEIVKNVQRDFCKPGKRLVGGLIHDLSITPQGQYESSTRDA